MKALQSIREKLNNMSISDKYYPLVTIAGILGFSIGWFIAYIKVAERYMPPEPATQVPEPVPQIPEPVPTAQKRELKVDTRESYQSSYEESYEEISPLTHQQEYLADQY